MNHVTQANVISSAASRRLISIIGRFALGLILVVCSLPTPQSAHAASSAFKVKDVVARELTNVNGLLFFVDINDGASSLLDSDGTPSGTTVIRDFQHGADHDPFELTNVNGTLFFVQNRALWKSDGTSAGTVKLKDFSIGSYTGYGDPRELSPKLLTNVNGTLFFQAYDQSHGWELWKSDGTSTGTVLVKDINPGSKDSYPSDLTNNDGTLFFSAASSTYGWELWKSDGTSAGTDMVKDSNSGTPSGSVPHNLVSVHGTVFFAANDGLHGDELWKSDGTVAGTVQVADINPGAGSSSPSSITQVNARVFFRAGDQTHGWELWTSDGTETGTRLVRDIAPGPNYSLDEYPYLTAANNILFFTADDGVHGSELWKSDGTPAGTVLVRDIYLGAPSASPGELTSVNDTMFFRAGDGLHGSELWRSDGTVVGTVLAADIIPGSTGSAPGDGMIAVGKVVFFNAGTPQTGRALWAYLADGDPFLDGPTIFGILPGGVAAVPIRFGNNGALINSVMITATLSADMRYVGDTLGTSPSIANNTITWRISDIRFRGKTDFRLRIGVTGTNYGTQYPLKLTMTAYQDRELMSRTVTGTLMVAHQNYLPVARR